MPTFNPFTRQSAQRAGGSRLFLAACFLLLCNNLFSQNILFTYQNPTDLYVCGSDQFSITLHNNQSVPLTGLQVTVTMSNNNIDYQPGTIVNATEFNIGNLSAPVFALPDLIPGTDQTITLTLKATCDLIPAINSGQLFTNTIKANFTGGNQQTTTLAYPVETGLLLITSIAPPTQNGILGQVVTRTIKLRNTRQGPINELQFNDQHNPGLSIVLTGIGGQNPTSSLFQASVPGSYFTAFGDGDALMEFGEEITLTEEITITDCGTPANTNPSLIIIGWGCNNDLCQSDSTNASVMIQASTQNPSLSFFPIYSPPTEQCGNVPSIQEVVIVNNGLVPATNVSVLLVSGDSSRLGIDFNGVQINSGSGWSPLTPTGGTPQTLSSCNLSGYYSLLNVVAPLVPPGDTVRLRFAAYFCQALCSTDLPALGAVYSYPKACPPNTYINGNFEFKPTVSDGIFGSKIYYDIGDCLESDSTYDFTWWVKSKRLLADSGYVQFLLQLPLGIYWSADCLPPAPEGHAPVLVETNSIPGGETEVRVAYALPFSSDSIFSDFCLKYICSPDIVCNGSVPNPPASGDDYTVFPPGVGCMACDLYVKMQTVFTTELNTDVECGISVCDEFKLLVNNTCGGGGGSGSGGGGLNLATAMYDSYRLNIGLADDNNDRKSDSNAPAASPLIRRDRFLPGDTMRNVLKVAVLTGSWPSVSFRLFNESWASDFGIDGGDEYKIGSGKLVLTNYDSLQFIGGTLTIKLAANGAQYECPLDFPSIKSDKHIFTLAQPNIRPYEVLDELTSMFNQYDISMASLAAQNCVPQGLLLTEGDSLLFVGDYKFKQNFTPNAANFPPLINFRNAICGTDHVYGWKLDGCIPPQLRQYSGYVEDVFTGIYSIRPCGNSTELSPFRYTMRIARENLFPYEVRPLASILDFTHSLPQGVPLLETRLNYLRLQENIPLFTNQLLTNTLLADAFRPDLSPYLSDPLDEGFSFQIGAQFGPSCAYEANSEATTHLKIQYPNMCFHDPVLDEQDFENTNGFLNGSATLELLPADTVLDLTTSGLELTFYIRNSSGVAAPFIWLSVESGGNLEDLELAYMPSQQIIPLVGGVYQLNSIPAFTQTLFRLRANNTSCDNITVHFHFGWDCDPVGNPSANSCGTYEKTIVLRPKKPELELVVLQQPEELPMCAISDYLEFEVYNANVGLAFGVTPSIKLPPGLSVAPGTSQYSYPAGGAYLALPNPAVLPGNVYQWNPSAVSATLAQNGLASVEDDPLNSIRIRFKVLAQCGFVSNAQPIYGAEAVLPCGISSNVLRKPGDPLILAGLTPSYGVAANLSFANGSGAAACGETTQVTASVTLDGTAMPGDSIYLLLPAGTVYVNGSYQAGANAPAGPPVGSGQSLQLPLPASLGIGQTLQFTITVRYENPAGCDDKYIVLQTREQTDVFCPLINENCNVYIATGEALLLLNLQNPDLLLKDFAPLFQNNQTGFTANLENAGQGVSHNPVVKFYYDQNQNGQLDPGDPLVGTTQSNQTIPAGGTIGISGNLNIDATQLCDLLAFIPGDDNCSCGDRVYPLGGDLVVTTAIGQCEISAVTLGVDSVAGNNYLWLSPGLNLSCTSCANTTYTPGPNVVAGDLITLVLQEKAGECTIERRFDIQFGGTLGLQTPDQTICKGESVELVPTPGGTYHWTGPGITDPAASIQLLQPAQTSTYNVTVTFAGGCTGTDQVKVTVLASDSINLGTKVTCPGVPVEVSFGVYTDEPGTYVQHLQKFNGCDSTVFLVVELVNNQTGESLPLCSGDSTMVFDSLFFGSGTICHTFTSVFGCDSTHCVTVVGVAAAMLPDTTFAGPFTQNSIQELDALDGFNNYLWDPQTGLDCYDCPVPTTDSLKETILYHVTVTDNNGCDVVVTYRLLVFPPCDPENAQIPNVFTPNDDGVNDVFGIIPFEGFEVVRSLEIYNRWGQRIYAGTGAAAQWDGRVEGQLSASDVYVWLMVVDCNGDASLRKGEVTLLR